MNNSKIHIEVAFTNRPETDEEELKLRLLPYINNFLPEFGLKHLEEFDVQLKDVAAINVCEQSKKNELKIDNTIFHFFKLNNQGMQMETFESGDGEQHDQISALNHWILPCTDFLGLWDSLHFDVGIKENLLKLVQTMMFFSKQNVDANIISCNRIVLLHGPPGTGKTSLCKALAQKVSIHMGKTYKHTHLIEINSHSLFSKWFSESGKLVMKLFAKIKDLLESSTSLIIVLIDEIESIAYSRSSISGDEPRDAVRVVNALITQLDQIRKHPNVLVLTTSNLTSIIDSAFLDRADLKQYVGNPSDMAISKIYLSAIEELTTKNVVIPYDGDAVQFEEAIGPKVQNICKISQGLSGRSLRKIPFLAAASLFPNNGEKYGYVEFLDAMEMAIRRHLNDSKSFQPSPQTENPQPD